MKTEQMNWVNKIERMPYFCVCLKISQSYKHRRVSFYIEFHLYVISFSHIFVCCSILLQRKLFSVQLDVVLPHLRPYWLRSLYTMACDVIANEALVKETGKKKTSELWNEDATAYLIRVFFTSYFQFQM